VLVLVAGVSTGVADPRTEAMLLFDQGQKEMKAGQFEKACHSFERSVAIYPDSGTKGSLARCYEKTNRLASAWLLWRQLADLAPSADLRKDAAAQAAKLAPKVAHYILKIATPAPGLTLTINGKAAALTDVPVPIDAGGVIVRAYAPSRSPSSRSTPRTTPSRWFGRRRRRRRRRSRPGSAGARSG
jgi:tetratricopeptide (TPR) repeat protein